MKFQINKPDKKKYIIQSVVAVLIVAVAIIADLVSKTAVVDACIADGMSATGSYHKLATVIEGFFYITYTQNTGGAWSIGGGSSAFMTIVIILKFIAVTLFLFILFFPDSRKNTFFIISLSLIAGGATGNLVDRLAFGYVRDFLSFYPFGQSFPIFNIADVCLVIGVIMMVVCIIIMFFKPKKKEVESERGAEKESLE
ncbi:MAG: signal peptidase II [Clostridia bacterium]|nr:signal peptidase II [Clostridia bacterium]